ncbi:MAG: tetratricopeptide repeat protein [Lentimicrobium sp.]|jgi:tetratricopeptide (TPR) repeat protein|nr:tetratricopeptide repeat protein [Lentimicrobium sp.]
MSLKSILYSIVLLCLPNFVVAQDLPEGGDDILSQKQMRMLQEQKKSNDLFFDATKAKLTENLDKAFTLFTECVTSDPTNDAAWYELSRIYYSKADISEAINSAEKAYALAPGNTWYSLSLAALYENNNQNEEALEIYQKLYVSDPDNTEYAYDLANLWIKLNKPNEAIKIYDELESRLGINEETSIRKHRIYLATGKSKKALEELEKLARVNAWDSRILSMLAEFYILEGKSDDALKTYKKIQEVDPDNAYIDISLADFYRQRNEMNKATESLKKGFANPYLDADTKIQVMMSYYSQVKDYPGIQKDVTDLAKILVTAHPNEPRVMMLYGEILMMAENYKEAKEVLTLAIQSDPGKYQVWENLLRCSAILEENEDLARDSKQAMELFPVQPLPYYFNGVANFMIKNYDQAIGALSSGVKIIAGDKKLVSDFYSLIGDAQHSKGEDAASFEAYDQSLKANPDNALVLNNYAYHLTLAGLQLDKALEMANRAITLAPENSYYLDTYAWVLYKQAKYDQALDYIEQAIKLPQGASTTVLEHYGDILFKLNRIPEAQDAWKQAIEKGEGSTFLESKVKDGKLYE